MINVLFEKIAEVLNTLHHTEVKYVPEFDDCDDRNLFFENLIRVRFSERTISGLQKAGRLTFLCDINFKFELQILIPYDDYLEHNRYLDSLLLLLSDVEFVFPVTEITIDEQSRGMHRCGSYEHRLVFTVGLQLDKECYNSLLLTGDDKEVAGKLTALRVQFQNTLK